MNRRDRLPGFFLFALFAVLLGPVLFTHRVYFHGDLTVINHPWRVLTAEQLQRGEIPLWNPYTLFGLPLLGNFQTGLFFPLSSIFFFFQFSQALGGYLLATYLAGALGAYLWLRNMRLPQWACFGGAAAFAASGCCVSQMDFPNLLGSLVWLPWFFLFVETPLLLALASAFSLLSGYPPVWAGVTFCLFTLGWLWPRRKTAFALYASLAAGMILAVALCAAALMPGLELARHSSRGPGLSMAERTNFSLDPIELAGLVHPELVRRWSFSRQEPHEGVQQVVWSYQGVVSTFTFLSRYVDPLEDASGGKYVNWKAIYVGLVAALASAAGLAAIAVVSPWRAAALVGYALLCVVLMLGHNFPVSNWIWEHARVLSFIRGPGRLSYLMLGLWLPATAVGLAALGRVAARVKARLGAVVGWGAAAAIAAELLVLGCGFYPTLPKDYYSEKGDLVDFLRQNLGGDRYYQYPQLEALSYLTRDNPSPAYPKYRETVFRIYKQKLFGISNVPFHLAFASGQYEPLVPAESVRAIRAFEEGDKTDVVGRMRWAGVRFLSDRKPIRGTRLNDRGIHLWHIYESPEAISRAYWLPDSARQALRGGLAQVPAGLPATPWKYERPREDRFRVSGTSERPGWLYVAEPDYPGWKAFVNGRPARIERALDAFSMVEAPAGPGRVDFIYQPASWKIGRWVSLAALWALAWLGLKELERWMERWAWKKWANGS